MLGACGVLVVVDDAFGADVLYVLGFVLVVSLEIGNGRCRGFVCVFGFWGCFGDAQSI